MPSLLSMSNGKKKINIRMKAFFPPGGEREKEVPYIFFHNFTACQWKLSADRCRLLAVGCWLSADRYPLPPSSRAEPHAAMGDRQEALP